MSRPGILLCLLLGACTLQAQTPADNVGRGARVEWARLRSDDPYWDRHAAFDRVFLEFIRSHTALDIDPEARWVRADSIDQLCAFPFLFAANIQDLAPAERANLAEYLRRGGFVLMDLCVEPTITRDLKEAILNEIRLLIPEFPKLRIIGLGPDHPVFSSYFQLKGQSNQLAAIYDGKRMIGVISREALECDLAGFHRFRSPVEAAQLLTNIYVYALAGDRSQPNLPPP